MNGPLRVVEAPGHAFADARRKPNATTDKYVSLINRASIAALEAAMGVPVDPTRFRANVCFDIDDGRCFQKFGASRSSVAKNRPVWRSYASR